MSRARKPTRRQKVAIAAMKLNPANWLVNRVSDRRLHLVHRYTGTPRTIYYEPHQR